MERELAGFEMKLYWREGSIHYKVSLWFEVG